MKKVLVVDDSKSVHSFVSGILEAEGFDLEHVYNGAESIERLENSALPKIDLILMDWEMPVMTGPEAIRKIREKGHQIPIYMMSSKSSPEDLKAMLDAGIQEYIMKPFTADILLDRLGRRKV